MLSTSHRKSLKAWLHSAKRSYIRTFRSFGPEELLAALRGMGIREGDAVLLHSGFSDLSGFKGTIEELTNAYLEAVGPQGHLLMVSLPYRDSSFAYLQRARTFDVRRTPSMMGMVSELFRRRPNVLRSLHPTHPVLVHGPRAEWFVGEHGLCVHPCGPGTPFGRLAEVDGKVAFFAAPFATYTFFHYLEHQVHDRLPFPLYTREVFEVPVIDARGQPATVRTHVFDPAVIARRRFAVFERAMRERGLIQTRQLGATTLELVRVRDSIACVEELARAGQFFYDMGPAASDGPPGPATHSP